MHVIALEYHDVVAEGAWDTSGFPGGAAATYKVSLEDFASHLGAVQSAGRPVVATLAGAPDVATAPILLTFDDGGAGFQAAAAERLERHGWRGSVFMTTGFIGQAGFLSAGDLRSLHARGHIIGTHSRTHPLRLATLAPASILEEWRASIADLEDILGVAVTTGSVPGGQYTRLVAELAATAGLTTLFTSEPETRVRRVDGCAVAGRFTLRRDDPASYVARLAARSSVARAGQWWRWNAKKVAKSLGGTRYLRMRDRWLGP